MIIDKVNGQPVPRYLIYDIIKFNVSSATKECIVALWDIQSPQVTVWLHSFSFDRGIFFGHRKFCWFCQDLYPSITTWAVSLEKALTWNGRVYWEIFIFTSLLESFKDETKSSSAAVFILPLQRDEEASQYECESI